jgi:hypothetical protein
MEDDRTLRIDRPGERCAYGGMLPKSRGTGRQYGSNDGIVSSYHICSFSPRWILGFAASTSDVSKEATYFTVCLTGAQRSTFDLRRLEQGHYGEVRKISHRYLLDVYIPLAVLDKRDLRLGAHFPQHQRIRPLYFHQTLNKQRLRSRSSTPKVSANEAAISITRLKIMY